MKQFALAAAILICSIRVDARVIRIVIEQRESPAFQRPGLRARRSV